MSIEAAGSIQIQDQSAVPRKPKLLGVAGAGWRPAQDVLFPDLRQKCPKIPMKRHDNTLSASSLEHHFSPCSAGPGSMLMNAHAPPWAGPQWAVDAESEVSFFELPAPAHFETLTHTSSASRRQNKTQPAQPAGRHHEMLREPKRKQCMVHTLLTNG